MFSVGEHIYDKGVVIRAIGGDDLSCQTCKSTDCRHVRIYKENVGEFSDDEIDAASHIQYDPSDSRPKSFNYQRRVPHVIASPTERVVIRQCDALTPSIRHYQCVDDCVFGAEYHYCPSCLEHCTSF